MSKEMISEVQKKWAEIGQYKTPSSDDLKREIELYKKMLKVFLVGDFYYFIFNPPQSRMEFVSPSIQEILGYSPNDFNSDVFLDSIHPDDVPNFVNFEATVVEFKKTLSPEQLMNYKSRYNYRIRKNSGEYIHILQQSITVQSNIDGAVLRNFVIHTDISYLKNDNKMTLSFIGLEGEPSFIDVKPFQELIPTQNELSNREMEIFQLLVQENTSKEIAEILSISAATVATHRKNILRKTNTSSVLQLVKLGLEKGWI